MQTIVDYGKRSGNIKAIASKSHIHRLLICAALSDKKTAIKDVTFSNDIMTTVSCLNGYLADIFVDSDTIIVQPYKKAAENCVLNLNESGSTYRFMVPVACAIGANVSFTGAQRLAQRPLSPLYELLKKHGCSLSEEGVFPLYCSKKLEPGEFIIPGDVSSQFISGLLFALPLLEGDSVIHITGKMESYPYIKMTLDSINTFGIEVEQDEQSFYIKGNQRYISPKEVCAEGDWSNAAFFVALGAMSEKGVTVYNVNLNSLQGDMKILDIVKRMGAKVEQAENAVFVSGNELTGTRIDASQIPDLVPILAVLACAAKGETVIFNAARLRLKESDRIESVYNMLINLGAHIKKTDDGFIINGNGALKSGTVDSANDHRIVMAASCATSITDGAVTINGSHAVHKSYPTFFEDLSKLDLEKVL